MGTGWRLLLASVLLIGVIHALEDEKAEESKDNTKEKKEENAGWEIVGEETGINPQYVKGDTGPAETKDLFSGFSDVQVHDGYVKGVVSELPQTNFHCGNQPYIPGLYADMEVQCQVYHVCFDNRKETFRCGEGTVFNQKILACDHWYNVRCEDAPRYYERNEHIGKTPDVSHFVEKPAPQQPKRKVHLEPPIYPVPQEPHHDGGGQGIKSTHIEPQYPPPRPPPIRQPPFPVPQQPHHPEANIKGSGYEEVRPPVKRPPPPPRQPPPPPRQPPPRQPPPRQPPPRQPLPPRQPSIKPPVFVPPEEIYHHEEDIKGYERPPPPRPIPQAKPPPRHVQKPSFPPPQVIHPNSNVKGGTDYQQVTITHPRPQPNVKPPVFPEPTVDLKGYEPPRPQPHVRPPSISHESVHPNVEVKGYQRPHARPHPTIEETHYEPPINIPPPPAPRPHQQARPKFPPPNESVHPNYEVKGYQPPRQQVKIPPPPPPPPAFESVHPHEEVRGYEPPPPPPPPRKQIKQPSFPPPQQVIHPNSEVKGYQPPRQPPPRPPPPPRHQPSRSQVQVKPKPFPQVHPEVDAKGYQPPPPPPPPRRPVPQVKPPVFPPPEQTIHPQSEIKGGDVYEPRPPPRPHVQPPYQPPSISTVVHPHVDVKGYEPVRHKPERTRNPSIIHPNQNVKGVYENTGSLAIPLEPLPPAKHSFPPQQQIHPNANVKGQVNYQAREYRPPFSGVHVDQHNSGYEEGILPFEHHKEPRHPPSPPAKVPYIPKSYPEPQEISFPPPQGPSSVRVNINRPRDYPRHQQRTNQKETRFTAPSSRGNQVKYVFPPYQEPDPSHPNANIKGGPGYRRPEPYSQPQPTQRFQRSQRLLPAQSNLHSSYGRTGFYPKPEFGRSNLEIPVAQVNYPFIRTGYTALESVPSVSVIDPFPEDEESSHQQVMMVDSEEE